MGARLLRELVPAVTALVAAGLVGCWWAPWARVRPDPVESVSGTAVAVQNCELCHAGDVIDHYAESLHADVGVRCGQCHVPGGHPDFSAPIADGKCGGCHQDQYQPTIRSPHFRTRRRLDLADRAARAALRAADHRVGRGLEARFAGDAEAGILGGRLCVACHYDEHRLGLDEVDDADFCRDCHRDKADHFDTAMPRFGNRCIGCHVRAGETVDGQVVNSHGFRMGGGATNP
jgi:hypothetical protein